MRVRFYHAALFSPTLATLSAAIRAGFLTSFPGLDINAILRHPPISEETIKGHLIAKRCNLRSTTQTYKTPHHIYNLSAIAPKTQHVYVQCYEATGKIFSDQTGPFLVPSVSGNH